MKAAIYTRISQLHDDPDDPGRGVVRQEEACRKLAEGKGWKVTEVYQDDDVSAFTGKERPQFTRLLADARKRQFDVVLVWKLDRFTRRTKQLLETIEELDDLGINFVTADASGIDTTTAMGKVFITLLGSFAEFESAIKSERLLAQRAQRAKEGKVSPGGRRAFGYASDGMTIIPDEAELIRELAQRHLVKGESARSIALEWADRGIKTPSGNAWRSSHLTRLLRSGRPYGIREHGDLEYDAEWPAILDRDLRPAPAVSTRTKGAKWPLTGILVCGECGKGMQSWTHGAGGRYRCTQAVDGTGCGMSVKAETVEAILIAEAVGRTYRYGADVEAEVKALQTQLADLTAQRSDLVDLYLSRQIAKTDYVERYESADEEISDLERQLASLTQDVVRDESLQQMIQHGQTADRRVVFNAALDSVEVAKAKPGKWFQPDRLTVHWADSTTQTGDDILAGMSEQSQKRITGRVLAAT